MSLTKLLAAFFLVLSPNPSPSFYDLSFNDIQGKPQKMDQFKGKVVLVVNTASQCGFTSQYAGLQKLYSEFKDKGFVVLGFPSNQFGGQEPGSDQEIRMFCEQNYKVSFPLFSKSDVKGEGKNPIFQFLVENQKAKEPGWNFTKYLIGKDGKLIERFSQWTGPDSDSIKKAVEKALQQDS